MIEIPEIAEMTKTFETDIQDITVKSNNRGTLRINEAKIVEAARYLYEVKGFRFIIATAMETREGIEILYHFSHDQSGLILNLNVVLDKKKPQIKSLTELFEAANWIEREMHELYGIIFQDHPNLEKLISEGNWAEGVYPYRKSKK